MVDKKLSEFSQITPAEIEKLICLFLDQNNAIKNGVVDFAALDALLAHKAGDETITGDKTFSGDTVFSGNATFNQKVNANISGSSGSCTGNSATATKATQDGSGNNIANTYATKNSPAFTGTPTSTTPSSATDNSTKIPTTAWVRNHRCTTRATTTSTASADAPAYVVENYKNGSSWYRIWSDGWIEQGGKTAQRSGNGYIAVTFLKPFVDTNYNVQQSLIGYDGIVLQNETLSIVNLTTTGCRLYMWSERASFWFACGY